MKKRNSHLAIFQDSRDFECALLAALGFSNSLITSRTGLSINQITYRLKRVDIRRSDYRNGHSMLAKLVTNKVHNQAKAEIEHKLRKLLT